MNWSLQKLKSKCQSQCNKKLTPDYPTVVQLSESRCLFPPSEVGRVKGPLSSQSSAQGAGPLQMAAGSKAMCRDLTASSPAVVLPSVAPAPFQHGRFQAGSCQLAKPARLPMAFHIWKSLPWALAWKHPCILTSVIIFKSHLESIIFQMQRLK